MCIFIASMHVCMYTHKHVNMRQQYSITFDIWMDYVVFFFSQLYPPRIFIIIQHHVMSWWMSKFLILMFDMDLFRFKMLLLHPSLDDDSP